MPKQSPVIAFAVCQQRFSMFETTAGQGLRFSSSEPIAAEVVDLAGSSRDPMLYRQRLLTPETVGEPEALRFGDRIALEVVDETVSAHFRVLPQNWPRTCP